MTDLILLYVNDSFYIQMDKPLTVIQKELADARQAHGFFDKSIQQTDNIAQQQKQLTSSSPVVVPSKSAGPSSY